MSSDKIYLTKKGYEEAPAEENNLITQIENLLKIEKNIIIIKPKYDDNIVDIGDNVELELTYTDGSKELEIFELNANYYTKHMQEIFINSLLGKAIYLKRIGSIVSYKTNNEKIDVKIVRKVNNHNG